MTASLYSWAVPRLAASSSMSASLYTSLYSTPVLYTGHCTVALPPELGQGPPVGDGPQQLHQRRLARPVHHPQLSLDTQIDSVHCNVRITLIAAVSKREEIRKQLSKKSNKYLPNAFYCRIIIGAHAVK